jgi:predicted transcriptional regulator
MARMTTMNRLTKKIAVQMLKAGKTLEEIGTAHGVTKQRAQQIVGTGVAGDFATKRQAQRIRLLRDGYKQFKGKPLSAYAEHAGVSVACLCFNGIRSTFKTQRLKPGTKHAKAVQMYINGESLNEIAAKLNTSKNAVCGFIHVARHEYGMNLPERRPDLIRR